MTMVYDLPIADTSAQPMSQVQGFTAPDSKDFSSAQLQEGGAALTKAGIATTQIVKTIQDDIDTATTKEMDNKLADAIRVTLYDPEKGYAKTAGKTALESRPGAIKVIQDAAKEIESGLQNDVQRYMFKKAAMVRMQSAMTYIDNHAMQQAKVYAGAEAKARMDGARLDALQNWAGWKDPQGLYARSKAVMMGEVDSIAELAGIPKTTTDKSGATVEDPQYKLLKQSVSTQLHSDVLNNMISLGQTTQAKEYYNAAVSAKEILPDKLDELNNKVKVATTATEADNLASKIWSELGPKKLTDAVTIFDLTQKARELAGDNEDVQKAAIAGLKERYGEWNGQQAEVKAQNISGVWKQVDSGASMRTIQLSQPWLNLSDTERHEIRGRMEQEASVRANRAAAMSQKELADTQRKEHMDFLKNGDYYLTITDPEALKKMSRAQVEALRGKFGMTPTQHLLDKWDAIQNPAKYGEAKMDSDDFNQVARTLGLDPLNTKNKEMRNQTGALKFHIEQVIDLEQSRAKRPLTREEKMTLVNEEMSRQVLVNPGAFSFDKNVPVIALTKEQAARVVVPVGERAKIVEAMKLKGIAPTEANLKSIYLKSISPGGSATFQGVE